MVLLALISILLGVVSVVLGVWAIRSRKRLKGVRRPAPVPRGSRRNAVMIIGLGGVGKTALIRALFHNTDADYTKSTDQYTEYRTDLEVDSQHGRSRRCCIFVGDYRGQNVGQLIAEFVSQQKRPYPALSYGFVNSLILVVDIFPPNNSDLKRKRKTPDLKRIRQNVGEWSDTALDAIFGLLTKETLSYVCLFINKWDRLDSDKSVVLKPFERLCLRLKKKADTNQANFQVVLGSAIRGDGVIPVKEALITSSREET